MGRKKSTEPPKQPGRLIRVSEEYAELVHSAALIEKLSIADFMDAFLTESTKKQYKASLAKETRRLEEKPK